MVKAVGLQEDVFPGKTQVGTLHEIVLITGVFQDIAKADIFREEAGDRGRGVAFKGCEQRDAALGGDHPGDCVVRARQLRGVAEIDPFVLDGPQFRGEIREGVVIEIGALKTFAVDVDEVQLRIRNRFTRLFVIGRKVGIAVARLGFHQLGDLMKRRAGIHRGEREYQRQQAVAEMVRMVTAAAQDPTQQSKHAYQRNHHANARKYVLTNPGAGQAVGQSIENGIVNPVPGKIVAGIEGNV